MQVVRPLNVGLPFRRKGYLWNPPVQSALSIIGPERPPPTEGLIIYRPAGATATDAATGATTTTKAPSAYTTTSEDIAGSVQTGLQGATQLGITALQSDLAARQAAAATQQAQIQQQGETDRARIQAQTQIALAQMGASPTAGTTGGTLPSDQLSIQASSPTPAPTATPPAAPAGMSTGAKVAIGVGAAAVIGGGIWLAMRSGKRGGGRARRRG